MWTFNKPSTWLLSLPEVEFCRIMEDARRQATTIKEQFKERAKKIAALRAERLREKREAARAKEEEKEREKIQLMVKVKNHGGLWLTEEEVRSGLARIKEAGRGEGKGRMLDALKIQIRFRKVYLPKSVKDPKDCTFSENNKALDVPSLTSKLVKLINQSTSVV